MKPEQNHSHVPADDDSDFYKPSRFVDEKISDEFDTEATSDRALAPAGLNNPFWN